MVRGGRDQHLRDVYAWCGPASGPRSSFTATWPAQINELESRPAHRWQSAEQSSLDAWYEKYPLYTRPEESISYYNKGQILGVLLDILIRDRTDNRASLDDVLRALNDEYAQARPFL